MNFKGTRGEASVSASEALIKGIAESGGLFVPESFPDLSRLVKSPPETYAELTAEVLEPFLTDFTKQELLQSAKSAYGKFSHGLIAPVAEARGEFFLELFHGPTLAFKDFALTILPYLMQLAAKKTSLNKKIIILTATSGDTGKAALAGFCDVKDMYVAAFYPENGVSQIQKLQMTTQEGDNTCVAGIHGNFDDAQRAVKKLFTSQEFNDKLESMGFVSSSANSINIGRLLPQIAYYFWAYAQLLKNGVISQGEKINFTVPTGNFGNILAGYYAAKMGLPVAKLICASNENKILTDFFQTGEYDANRGFYRTISPSMDILISSNLERLLYDLSSADYVNTAMESLKTSKRYNFLKKTPLLEASFANEAEALAAIGEVYKKGYVMDTHTAVGYAAYKKYVKKSGDTAKNVYISTASPYKFAGDVLRGLNQSDFSGFAAVKELASITGLPLPAQVSELEQKQVLHSAVLPENGIEQFVFNFLNTQFSRL